MRTLSRDLAHALASEYVVGTLPGRVRRRFEAYMAGDPAVEAIVRQWERGLTPLAERVAPVEPPARVWKAIESRIGGQPASGGAWSSVGFWRSFGLLTGGVASVLLAAFLYISTGARNEPTFVAVLTSADAEPRMVVSMHAPGLLRARVVHPWEMGPGQSLELWVLPKTGAPRSLGLVANSMGDTMMRIDPGDPRVKDANAFAVTMEPAGGSPTGQPTSKPVCHGMIAPVKLRTI